ncbi:MAG: class I SAM-dependent methyltransferase [Candidatus Methanomethylicaceae archaeon]
MPNYEHKYYNQRELWEKSLLSVPAEQERIHSTIELIPSDVRTILDVGCGNGAFLNSLPDGYQTIGLDLSQEALKYVKAEAIRGNIAALPFKSASFDLITCLEVLEHLPSDGFNEALRELQRVSRKYIIVSVPNDEDLDYSLVICPVCRCRYNPWRHVRSFNSEKVKTLFESFTLLEIKEVGPLEPRPQYNRFLYAVYLLYKNSYPPSIAVCPQCGYQPIGGELSVFTVKSGGLPPYVLSLLKLFAKTIWRPRWRHRWLVALYVRKD